MPEEKFPWTNTPSLFCNLWKASFRSDPSDIRHQENCFAFGSHAEYYVENGMGRYITIDEAKAIVKKNAEVGKRQSPWR